MKNGKQKFQRMWEGHAMGALSGKLIANNFSRFNLARKKAGLLEKNAVFFYEKNIGTQFYNSIAEMKKSATFGYKKFTNTKRIKDYLKKSKQALNKGDKIYKSTLKIDLKKKNLKELLIFFKELIEVFDEIYTFFHACQPQYFFNIERKIQDYFENKFAGESGRIYSILASPTKFNLLRIEKSEWLKIVKGTQIAFKKNKGLIQKEIYKNKNLIKKIKNHSDKYIYLGTVEANNPWDEKYYIRLLKKQIRENIDAKIEKIKKEQTGLKLKQKSIIKSFKINNDIIELLRLLSEASHNRLALRFGWTKVSYLYIRVVEEIARRKINYHFNDKTIWDYLPSELEKAILYGQFVKEKEIKKRQESFLFIIKNGKTNFYAGQEAIKEKVVLIPEKKYSVRRIRGQVGCEGKAKGNVSLFLWIETDLPKKMEKMKKGSILVAGQTRPFLMPAIRKAAAIITDEGGLLCHAAIISRELNIPCIIGTEIATKVLKDGDLVEVDANKGMVKIVKK